MTSLLSIAALITAIATLISSLRTSRKASEIHILVNSKMTTALDEIVALKIALKKEQDK